MSDAPQKQQDNQRQERRIPVRLFVLVDQLTIPGGPTFLKRVDCSPQLPGRPYVIAHEIPARQVIEIAWHRNEATEPLHATLHLSRLESWVNGR